MYTVLWTDLDGNDHWDRFDTRIEVTQYLKNNDIEDEDTIIFCPDSDYYATNGYSWMMEHD